MTKRERHAYYASREWALLKQQVRERSGGKCERCKTGDYEQTHHVTYERMGRESLDDLLAVCAPCHEYLSGVSDDDPVLPEFKGSPRFDCASYLLCPRGHNAIEVVDAYLSRTNDGFAAVTVFACRECNNLTGSDVGRYALIQRSGDYVHGGWCRWDMFDESKIQL